MYPHSLLGQQLGRQLWHRNIRLGLNPADQYRQIRCKLAPTRGTSLPSWFNRSRPSNPRCQLYGKTRADFEPLRSGPSRLPALNLRLDTLPKLDRMGFPHAGWPPHPQHAS